MGNSSAKFQKYIQNGDEYAALQIFQTCPELQQSLDPNSWHKDSLQHNTPLHFAAIHAMKPFLRIFLYELKGNPNKPNSSEKTALHLLCQGDSTQSLANQERRALCLTLMLQWSDSENNEKLNLNCVDNEGNTALHYAAQTGLKKCIEILISQGANMFIENKSSETICDIAEKNKHDDIAQYLETKMLFFTNISQEDSQASDTKVHADADASGLRDQDLQEAKDQLLVETSDMFHVPLFSAEVLLRKHEWSRQVLLEAWMKNPETCCKEVGISPPHDATSFSSSVESFKTMCEAVESELEIGTSDRSVETIPVTEKLTCGICLTDLPSEEDLVLILCMHHFCKECWKIYLTSKIEEGEAHNILCPSYECSFVVPVDVIERLVSPEMVKRYLQFDIKAFVESNPTMKWCPYPGCARAVKLPDVEKINEEILAITFSNPPTLSHSVDCGNGHYFCWECLGEAHAPCGCEKWTEWHKKIADIKPLELKNTYSETEQAENSLWMVTNSKLCPNCKSPIQRNEGCNHMKCLKCKYDFCWVCLDSWKKHNPGTGGYFRCNRHVAVKKAEAKTEALIDEAEKKNKQMQELKRFLQYYTRFKNHENSYKFEEPFIQPIREKMNIMSSKIPSSVGNAINMSFLDDAIYELLRARRILCGTYVYGFYLEDNGYNKTIFEYLQSELEEYARKISDAIARTYIQMPHSRITQLTMSVKKRRQDLLSAVHKGLIPPETPPSTRRSRRYRLPGLMGMDPIEDPFLPLESLVNLDPNDPWIVNQYGKHTNVAAVCDWPDYESDEEVFNPVLASVLGVCSREGCKRPRVKNKRTGEIHEYCSLYCKHWKVLKSTEPTKVTATIDPSIDVLISLELSKLQMLEGRRSFSSNEDSSEEESVYTSLMSTHSNLNLQASAEETVTETPDDEANPDLVILTNDNPEQEGEEDRVEVVDSTTDSPEDNFYRKLNINLFLKSFDNDSRNINLNVNDDCLKIAKDLFKVDDESCDASQINAENCIA